MFSIVLQFGVFRYFVLSGYGQELRVLRPPSKDKAQHVFFWASKPGIVLLLKLLDNQRGFYCLII